MAAFLSGLMGALRSAGGGIAKAGHGLMGAVDPAVSAARGVDPLSDLGDFKFGPGGSVVGVRPADAAPAPAKPGFFQRINTADPTTGLSTVDKWDRFGATMQDLDDGGSRAAAVDKRAAGRLSQQQQAQLNGQIDELFADDPRMRFLMKANPDKAAAALADVYKSRNETRTVAPGSTVGTGDGPTWMAPEYGQADGYSYRISEDGFDWGDQRGPTHGEVETGRHNRSAEETARGNLGVARGNLDVSRSRLAFDRSKEGGGAGLPAGGLPPLPPGFRRVR